MNHKKSRIKNTLPNKFFAISKNVTAFHLSTASTPAAGAAAAATETAEAVSGGLTPAGKTVLVVSIGVLFLIGFKKREKTDKK